MFNNEEFGRRLRRRRRDLDLSQEQLAKMAHMSQNIIARYESGTVTPGLDKAALLADVLGVQIDDLAGMPAPQEPAKATAGSVA